MKKQISLLLIASHLSMGIFSTGAFAETPAAASPVLTPEAVMVTNLQAIKAMNLSQDEASTQVTDVITQYVTSIPANQLSTSEDRLGKTMVDLHLMSSEQADIFRSSLDKSVQDQTSKNPQADNLTVVNSAVQTALLNAKGAQFSSACIGTMAGAVGVGAAAVAIGIVLMKIKTDCVTQSGDGPVYADDGGLISTGPWSDTTCQNPHMVSGLILAIAGAVAGLSALIDLSVPNSVCRR